MNDFCGRKFFKKNAIAYCKNRKDCRFPISLCSFFFRVPLLQKFSVFAKCVCRFNLFWFGSWKFVTYWESCCDVNSFSLFIFWKTFSPSAQASKFKCPFSPQSFFFLLWGLVKSSLFVIIDSQFKRVKRLLVFFEKWK